MKEFNIPSVSPELGNDNLFSTDFYLPYDFVAREVLRDNHPWIEFTMKKLNDEMTLNPIGQVTETPSTYVLNFTVTNTGLTSWTQCYNLTVLNTTSKFSACNLKVRESKTFSITMNKSDLIFDSKN